MFEEVDVNTKIILVYTVFHGYLLNKIKNSTKEGSTQPRNRLKHKKKESKSVLRTYQRWQKVEHICDETDEKVLEDRWNHVKFIVENYRKEEIVSKYTFYRPKPK